MKMPRGSLSTALGFSAHTEVILECPLDPKAHFWTPLCEPRNRLLRRLGLGSGVAAYALSGS